MSQRTIVAACMTFSVAIHAIAIGMALKYTPPLRPSYFTSKYVPRDMDEPIPDELADTQTPKPPMTPLPEDLLIMGTLTGAGDANQDTPGDRQTALKAIINQASTSQDPQGVESVPQSQPMQQAMTMQGLQTAELTELKGVGSQAGIEKLSIGLPDLRAGLAGHSTDERSIALTPAQSQGDPTETADKTQKAQPQPDAAPPAPAIKGQEKLQTQTDSDLFSDVMDVEVRAGKMLARKGREVKLKRPKFNLTILADSATLSFPASCLLRVTIDEAGFVRRVQFAKSTGSASLDRAIEVAMYDSWIQPQTRNGQTVGQTVTIPYVIY